MRNRSTYWDNIKGFLILFVVFGHILYQLYDRSGYISSVSDYIYMFHMPAFVFVSGYFGKSENSRSFKSIFKLVFLYFIFNSITLFIKYQDGLTSLIEPLYSYWYLIALIVWRLTAHRIAKFKGINIILFAAAIVIGFFPSVDNQFAVGRIIGFYPFYMLGYHLSSEKSSKLTDTRYRDRALLGTVALLCAAILGFASREFLDVTGNKLNLIPYASPVDALGRTAFFGTALLAVFAIRCFAHDKEIPLITMFGENSLWIFILHRMFALWSGDLISILPTPLLLPVSIVVSFGICLLFGNRIVAKYMNRFLDSGVNTFTEKANGSAVAKIVSAGVAAGLVVVAVFNALELSIPQAPEEQQTQSEHQTDVVYPAMTNAQKEAFDKAFRITFAGDLILLEDQVKLGVTGNGYDFNDVFERAKPYISSADLAIGVFEGPMAGKDKGYTTGNFDDGKKLYLNFPDEYAEAVKNAGFDLVTTANNHLMDKGEEGAKRTLEILDKAGLDHTGSYRDAADKDKNRIKLVEKDGIKIAVLSYTFCSNYVPDNELIGGKHSYITSMISGTEGAQFEKLKAQVETDFKQAKSLSPDLILVLPHIGTQFQNNPDEEQKVWFKIFKDNGADIILGDHPHVVEPVEIENINGRTVFTAYCPGNFANRYRDKQGDTSMLVDVYIDRDSKTVIGGSVIPLYTYAPAGRNYRAVPIYDIENDPVLRKELTTDDLARAKNAHGIVTEVVFGHKLDMSSVSERYYFNTAGLLRTKTTGLELTDKMKNGPLYRAISDAKSVCFVGDSVTEGTKNGGTPWYEPIEEHFPGKSFANYSKGGCTVSYMLDNIDHIPHSDLYVIALGTNDVRYRNEQTCAMTADEYVNRLNELKEKLLAKSSGARFIFIAPWYSTDGDIYCDMTFDEKSALNEEYSKALEKYCTDNSFTFINANPYIKNILSVSTERTYLLDHIHPNATRGVRLYSEAVFLSGKS